ncbi:MAG: hypothetical protein ACWGOY_14995, partial [Anaerolineales bacterium]
QSRAVVELVKGAFWFSRCFGKNFNLHAFCIISNSYKEIIKIKYEYPDNRVICPHEGVVNKAMTGISLTKVKISANIS